jgi:disulfide bond formation protein DsbB
VDAEQVATFSALLLIGGSLGGLVALAVPAARARVAESALVLAAVVAIGAMAGSLYFSESAGYVPCELCWFQRIAMYPLGLMLTIAAFSRDRRVWNYVLPQASIGLLVSLYHIQLQAFPDQSSFCDAYNPCSAKWVQALGFITIPMMAGASFALIIGLGIVAVTDGRHRSGAQEPAPIPRRAAPTTQENP